MIYRQPVTGVLYRSNFESSFVLARCRARIAQMPIRNNSILRLWNGLSAATLISECNLSSAASEKDRRPPRSDLMGKRPSCVKFLPLLGRNGRKNATRGNGGRKRVGRFEIDDLQLHDVGKKSRPTDPLRWIKECNRVASEPNYSCMLLHSNRSVPRDFLPSARMDLVQIPVHPCHYDSSR